MKTGMTGITTIIAEKIMCITIETLSKETAKKLTFIRVNISRTIEKGKKTVTVPRDKPKDKIMLHYIPYYSL